jgi:type IV pilus assembly protein PilW
MEIINGASNGSDQLILRRNLLDYVLPVCKDINSSSAQDATFVAKNGGGNVPPGCSPVPDTDGDGWPDNIEAWKAYRLANGGSVLAYIYDPVTKLGEFFTYDWEDNSQFKIHRANGVSWAHDYASSDQPRVYIIEQKRYLLTGDVLQYVVNEDTAHPYNLVNHLTDFQTQALMSDGTTLNSMPSTTDWTKLQSLQVTLTGSATFSGRTLRRTVTSRFFPRNILSAQ